MLGVTSCWNCQSSNLKPFQPEWEDPYGREHYTCRDCGQRVSVSTLTLRVSGGGAIRWLASGDGEVLVYSVPGHALWQNRVFRSTTPVEKKLIGFRLNNPEGELERAGRLVIRRG